MVYYELYSQSPTRIVNEFQAEMRGQQGAAGEVIELLAQKSGSHPMGIMALLGDGVLGELQMYNLNKSKS